MAAEKAAASSGQPSCEEPVVRQEVSLKDARARQKPECALTGWPPPSPDQGAMLNQA